MAQSLSQLYTHLTFGTKNRYPFIKPENKQQLHAYIAGILKNLNSSALIINSVPHHIHILFRLSKNHPLAKVVEEVKKQSSKYIKTFGRHYGKFAWQGGYGAFSVSSSKLEIVRQYIEKQEVHHKTIGFREETESFLKAYHSLSYN